MRILVWEMRKKKGLTLIELAKRAKMGKTTVNDIENEKLSPTIMQLEKLAIALNSRITELFESEYK